MTFQLVEVSPTHWRAGRIKREPESLSRSWLLTAGCGDFRRSV